MSMVAGLGWELCWVPGMFGKINSVCFGVVGEEGVTKDKNEEKKGEKNE